MAHQNDWRGWRGRSERDRPGSEGSGEFWNPDRQPPGEGFQRRGWRPGSDYYGNDPGRYGGRYGTGRGGEDYGAGPYEYAGERAGGQRGIWENQDIDYSGRDIGRESPGPFRGRGPKGYKRSDERIREDVCERLTQDDRVDASNIEVTVKNCEVTLSGSVGSREEKRRAEDIIDDISGVTDVSNRLRVSDERTQGAGEQGRAPATTQTTTQPGQGSRH